MKRTVLIALLFAVALSVPAGGFPRTGEAADYWYKTVGASGLEDPLHFGQRTVSISRQGLNYRLTFADERYIEPDEPPDYTDNIVVAGITEFYVYNLRTGGYVNYLNPDKTASVPAAECVQTAGGTDYLQCLASFDVTLETSGDLGVINWDPSYLKLPASF